MCHPGTGSARDKIGSRIGTVLGGALTTNVNVPFKTAPLSLSKCPPASSSQALSGPSSEYLRKSFLQLFLRILLRKSSPAAVWTTKKETRSSGNCYGSLIFYGLSEGCRGYFERDVRVVLRGTTTKACHCAFSFGPFVRSILSSTQRPQISPNTLSKEGLSRRRKQYRLSILSLSGLSKTLKKSLKSTDFLKNDL